MYVEVAAVLFFETQCCWTVSQVFLLQTVKYTMYAALWHIII